MSANNENKELNASFYDSVLLVKDFDSAGFETNDELTTNAETPAIATEGLIRDPKNPYTGKKISRFKDQKGNPELIYTFDWQTSKNNGKAFLPADWFTILDNIYEENNWEYIGYK